MPNVVSEWPNKAPKAKYPWSEWMTGEIMHFQKGVDYNCNSTSFRSRFAHHAREAGGDSQGKTDENNVWVQFIPNTQADEPREGADD